jgi:hypothetical protein
MDLLLGEMHWMVTLGMGNDIKMKVVHFYQCFAWSSRSPSTNWQGLILHSNSMRDTVEKVWLWHICQRQLQMS